MSLRVDGPNKTWICIKHTNTHNHSLLPEKYIKLLGANRSIPPEIEEIVRELCQSCYGVSITILYSLLPVMYPNVDTSTYSKVDMQNLMTSIRNKNRTEFDAQRLVDELKLAQKEDPEFYFKYKVNGKCILCIYILRMCLLCMCTGICGVYVPVVIHKSKYICT